MHHEKKASEHLDKVGIENFVPVQQELRQWSGRCKLVTSILFPMMAFVYVDPREHVKVLSFSTVSRYTVMYDEDSPTVIPDEQMARPRFTLDYSEESIGMNSSPLTCSEKVRTIKGPLTDPVSGLVNADGKSRTVARLNMLGCVCADTPVSCVESTAAAVQGKGYGCYYFTRKYRGLTRLDTYTVSWWGECRLCVLG